MAKTYKKKKDKPNSPGPKYRTPSSFRSKKFDKKNVNPRPKTASFKTQHRG